MKKKLIFFSTITFALLGFSIFFIVNQAASRTKPYVYGDAINYQGQIIFGSTNMDGVEIFILENDKIVRTAKFKSYDATYGGWDDFNDIAFNQEGDNLFMYLTDGRYLYKFNVSDPYYPIYLNQVKDNAYDWFRGVGRTGNKIYTIGTKGLKIWNSDMQVINSVNLTNADAHQIKISEDGCLVFNFNKDILQIYDVYTGEQISSIEIIEKEEHQRNIFYDQTDGLIYLVDDSSLRQFNLPGQLVNSFRHISKLGYDADGIIGESYLYFSDGIGLVKINKATMEPLDWVYTTELGGDTGWAMTLKVVPDYGGEKLVVFNNSNILVLDNNLNKIDSIRATDEQFGTMENLSLTYDRRMAVPGTYIILSGKGFGINEDLKITFADKKYSSQTDDNGRFTQIILVPEAKPGMTDIKVDGLRTKLTYSISFQITKEN